MSKIPEIDKCLVPGCHTKTHCGVNEYVCIKRNCEVFDCGFKQPHIIRMR